MLFTKAFIFFSATLSDVISLGFSYTISQTNDRFNTVCYWAKSQPSGRHVSLYHMLFQSQIILHLSKIFPRAAEHLKNKNRQVASSSTLEPKIFFPFGHWQEQWQS